MLDGVVDEFETELEVGDQFMGVKPWLGAVKKPEWAKAKLF
jgi:hypothetical protein